MMMSPLDGSVETKGWLAYHLESRRPMIIALRVVQPDYWEVLLMTHHLPCIAPCCCLLFAYICGSSMDLWWLSAVYEPLQKRFRSQKQSLTCFSVSWAWRLTSTGGQIATIYRHVISISICCILKNPENIQFYCLIMKHKQVFNKHGAQDINLWAAQDHHLGAFGPWGQKQQLFKFFPFSLCRMF